MEALIRVTKLGHEDLRPANNLWRLLYEEPPPVPPTQMSMLDPEPGTQRRMSLRDVSFQSSYNPDNCSDIIGRLYEPALSESVRYDRTTYGFSPAGLINAAAGIAGLVRNGGRIQLICDQTLEADMVQAVIDGRSCRPPTPCGTTFRRSP